MSRIACVTMMKDEDFFFPVWFRYYAGHFGAEHLFVLDHGSARPVAEMLPADLRPAQLNVFRLPPPDECSEEKQKGSFDYQRFDLVSLFLRGLLSYYDVVIFNDTDEIFMPNPNWYGSLPEYFERNAMRGQVRAGVGLEIVHDPQQEPAFDPLAPIFAQRQYFRWNFLYSKPHILGTPCDLLPHTASVPFLLDPDLYLVHMKFIDRNHLYGRQEVRQSLVERLGLKKFVTWKKSGTEIESELDELNALKLHDQPSTGRRLLKRHLDLEGPTMVGAEPGLSEPVKTRRSGYCLIDYMKPNPAWLASRKRHRFDRKFAETGV